MVNETVRSTLDMINLCILIEAKGLETRAEHAGICATSCRTLSRPINNDSVASATQDEHQTAHHRHRMFQCCSNDTSYYVQRNAVAKRQRTTPATRTHKIDDVTSLCKDRRQSRCPTAYKLCCLARLSVHTVHK